MAENGIKSIIQHVIGRTYFPHRLSSFIDNPIRRLIITPEQLADRLSLTDSSIVLEIGPGSGYFRKEIARHSPEGRLTSWNYTPPFANPRMGECPERTRGLTSRVGHSHEFQKRLY